MNKHDAKTGESDVQDSDTALRGRRRVLEIMGTAIVAVPVLGLSACGGDDSGSASSSSAPMPAKQSAMESAAKDAAETAENMAGDMADEAGDMADEAADSAQAMADDMSDAASEAADDAAAAADTIATDGGMARVDENSPQAQGLAYRHDATTVDASVQTRYKEGQQCSNCALFQGGDKAWGGCPLFAGKQVKATGWCNAFAPAA